MEKFVKKMLIVFCALAIGCVNGFFGGGGGMLLVPVLQHILGHKAKSAHATAILIILPVSIASAVVYIIGGNYGFGKEILVSFGFVAGGLLGAFVLTKIANKILSLIFSLLMIFVGIKMVIG